MRRSEASPGSVRPVADTGYPAEGSQHALPWDRGFNFACEIRAAARKADPVGGRSTLFRPSHRDKQTLRRAAATGRDCPARSGRARMLPTDAVGPDYARSNRSMFITLAQALAKSCTNLRSLASQA